MNVGRKSWGVARLITANRSTQFAFSRSWPAGWLIVCPRTEKRPPRRLVDHRSQTDNGVGARRMIASEFVRQATATCHGPAARVDTTPAGRARRRPSGNCFVIFVRRLRVLLAHA